MGGICSLTDSINFLFKEHPLSTPCMPTIVPKKTGTVPVNINSNILGTQICKQTNITLGMLDLASFFLPSFFFATLLQKGSPRSALVSGCKSERRKREEMSEAQLGRLRSGQSSPQRVTISSVALRPYSGA